MRACVVVRKSSSRYLSVIVRARSPCARSRAATASASCSSVARSRFGVGGVLVVGVLLAQALGPGRLGRHLAVVLAAREALQVVAVGPDPPLEPAGVERRERADRRARPSLASASSSFGPTPHSRRTGSGARNAASVPGGTTTRPSGLRMSEATLATSFEVATPTEAVSAVSSRIACFSLRAIVSPEPSARALPVTSRNASSIETGSTRSVKRPRIAMIRSDSRA